MGILMIGSYGSIPGYYASPRFWLILIGGLMGTIMLINVWESSGKPEADHRRYQRHLFSRKTG